MLPLQWPWPRVQLLWPWAMVLLCVYNWRRCAVQVAAAPSSHQQLRHSSSNRYYYSTHALTQNKWDTTRPYKGIHIYIQTDRHTETDRQIDKVWLSILKTFVFGWNLTRKNMDFSIFDPPPTSPHGGVGVWFFLFNVFLSEFFKNVNFLKIGPQLFDL